MVLCRTGNGTNTSFYGAQCRFRYVRKRGGWFNTIFEISDRGKTNR